jgi:glycosyltransferase involved in cell wall biosynthesis
MVIGRNDGAYLDRSLRSVFSQQYDRFRVVYVDDGSVDRSEHLAQALIDATATTRQTSLVRHAEPLGLLGSLKELLAQPQDEIVIVLEASQELAHEWVLDRLNRYFANPDVWVVIGGGVTKEGLTRIPPYSYERDNLKDSLVKQPMLTAFHARLFGMVDEEDLTLGLDTGDFEIEKWVHMVPIIEMSEDHTTYVDEPFVLGFAKPLSPQEAERFVAGYRSMQVRPPYPKVLSLES